MKKTLVSLAVLALASAALAEVNPSRPMMTGHGNVVATQPAKVIVTNQTAAKPEETQTLEAFQVTGSLIGKPVKAAPRR
jgi:hypothetical protein